MKQNQCQKSSSSFAAASVSLVLAPLLARPLFLATAASFALFLLHRREPAAAAFRAKVHEIVGTLSRVPLGAFLAAAVAEFLVFQRAFFVGSKKW